jgi:hypothetical protein
VIRESLMLDPKAQRYGHPCERPIFTSSIPPADFTSLVVSFFSHGLKAVEAKNFWKWEEVHCLNRSIQWDLWSLHYKTGITPTVRTSFSLDIAKVLCLDQSTFMLVLCAVLCCAVLCCALYAVHVL